MFERGAPRWGHRRGGGRRREARCSVGFAGKKLGSLCDIEMMLRVRWIGRRWMMARGFIGEELSGEKRRWRRSLRLLGEMREAEEWARGCVREGVKAVARVISTSKKEAAGIGADGRSSGRRGDAPVALCACAREATPSSVGGSEPME